MISSQKYRRLWNPEWWGLYLSFLSQSFRNKPTATWKDQRKPTDITPTAPVAPCGPRVHCHGNLGHMCCYLQALTSQRCQCHYTPILTQTGGAEGGGGGGAKWQKDMRNGDEEFFLFIKSNLTLSNELWNNEATSPALALWCFYPQHFFTGSRASCSAAECLTRITEVDSRRRGVKRLKQTETENCKQTNVRECEVPDGFNAIGFCRMPQNQILQRGAVIIFGCSYYD